MRPTSKRLLAAMLFASATSVCTLPALHAQSDTYTSAALPDSGKILVIVRESTKPGKDGEVHEKTEKLYSAAMRAGKSTDYYTGMVSLTGVPRALFFSSYSSLADLESKRAQLPETVNAMLERANEADGAALDSTSIAIFERRDELSTNVKTSPGSSRYLDIGRFEVKPGHEQEFEQASVLYMKDLLKAAPAMHWTCYSSIYGHSQGTVYIFVTALKTLAEADAEQAAGKAFGASTSAKDLKTINEALMTGVISVEANLFRIRPALSFPAPQQMAADPAFWTPAKPAAKPAAKAAAKPAQ